MRIRGATTDLEEAGLDTEGMASSTAKLREEIMALSGVDIMLDSTTFKSTYKIMEELADKWEHLTDIQQASVTELIAGKRQGNIVSSLMTNFDIAQNALKTSLNSSGSAMEEHEKYMDSMEAKMSQLSAAWQSLSLTFMDSSALKTGIDVIKSFVEALEWLIDNFGLLGTVGLGTAGFSFFKFLKDDGAEAVATIEDVVNAINNIGDTVSNVTKGASGIASVADDVADAVNAVGGDIDNATDVLMAITPVADDVVDTIDNIADTSNKGAKAIDGIGDATSGVASAAGASSAAMLGWVAAIAAVVAVLGLAYNQYKKNKEEAAKLRQETIQSSNEFLEASSSFEKAYIKYSGRTDLTAQEESELESAIHGTVDALGDKSSALQDVVNSSNDYLASLERIKTEELKATERAAIDKREAAAGNLKETAIGWESFDGSEVDILLRANSDVNKIISDMDSEFINSVQKYNGKDLQNLTTQFQFRLSGEADVDEIVQYYDFLLDFQEKLIDAKDEGLINADDYEEAYGQVSEVISQLSETVSVYTDSVYEAAKAHYQLQNGIPKTTEEYVKMRETLLGQMKDDGRSFSTLLSVAGTLDSEYADVFDLSDAETQARKFVNIIKGYGDGTKDGTDEISTVETFLNMRTAVNNNECTVGEYLSELSNVTSMAENFSEEERKEFNSSFGLDTDAIKEQYDSLYNYLSRNYLNKLDTKGMTSFDAQELRNVANNKVNEILNNLTATELSALMNIKAEIDWEYANIDDIRNQIKKEAEFVEAMNYTIAIDVETESIDALNSALAESVSATGLSSESIAALKGRYSELASQGYDLSAMFEETSNGIHLNKNAVSEFEQALASQKLSETDEKLGVLEDRYKELTGEIENCTDAGERAHLYSEQQEVAQKINDLATLAAQYKGLTSAYNAWQNVESSGSERDMYEGIIEGFETVKDEMSRGWYDDGTIKFLELLKGGKATIFDGKGNAKEIDIATASASELKQVWNSLDDTIKGTSYSIRSFFTTDKDGNSTSTGAYNFLRAVEELGKNGGLKAIKDEAGNLMDISKLVERNADGKIVAFDFNVVGGDKAVADALGVSEEMVQIIQRTLDDAGFVVTLDGKYTLLADLKTSAEEANDALKKLKSTGLKELEGVDLNFDFNVDTVQGYQEQLEKATTALDKFRDKNGKLKTDDKGNLVEGAKEALEIAQYYTAAMDKLTEPKFMQIDVSTVDEELQEPIEKIQKIGDLCKKKHQVALTGDTKEIEKVEKEIDKVAEELEKLDEDVKAEIGIDADWTAEEIADRIEKGEIEIPAELQLDVQMSEDLKDMRLLMMRQLGLVSEEEVKLKIGYEIDEDTVNNLTPEQQTVVVDFIAKNEDWFDKLTDEEKEVAIELVASGDLDGLSDEKKTVVVEFVTENQEKLEKLSDKAQEVVITFVTENEEWFDKLSEDKQDMVIELVVNGIDLDSLEDEEKEVVIKYVEENKEEWDKLSNQEKQVIVDIIADDSALKALEEHGVEIEAFCNIFGVEKVDDLKAKLDGLTDEQILVLAEVLGQIDVEKLKTTVAGLDDKTVQAIAQAIGEGDVNGLKTIINGLDDKTVQAIAQALGYSDVNELNSAIDNLDPKTVQAIAQALGITDVDSLRGAINRLSDKDVKAVATVDGKDDVTGLKGAIDNLKGKTITVWAQIKQKASNLWDKLTGGGGVDGTAHVNGTAFVNGTAKKSGRAFKQGDWGTKDSGVALGGELAPELLVRDGRWHLIGEKGAEFFGYKKGDIIFNGDQTREIFEKGKITHGNSRGRALASGTAFSKGTGGGEEPESTTIVVGTNSFTGKSYTKSTDDSKNDFEETIDWIEIAIDRIERSIDNLDRKANSVYKTWSTRNTALTNQISKVGEEINLQQKAYDAYMSAASGVGLSEAYASKVRNGTIDIETITDEVLKEKIDDYQNWFEKAIACKDAIEELKETEASLFAQRFENVQSQYDAILQGYDHTKSMLNEYISQAEEKGYIVSKKYYEALVANEKSNISELQKQQSALIKARDEAVESGKIAKYSEEW